MAVPSESHSAMKIIISAPYEESAEIEEEKVMASAPDEEEEIEIQQTGEERFELFNRTYISTGNNNESVTRHHDGFGFAQTAYGSIAMLCNEERSGIHHFTIRIDECKGTE